jgi:probable rRNA maturation factor
MDDDPPSLDDLRRGCLAASGEWIDPDGRLRADERSWLTRQFGLALGQLGVGGEVRVMIVGDEQMDAAHRRYSGVAGTTDVLTFDLRDNPAGPLDTDLLVCVDEAARQAAARGHDRARELLLYAVHGVLHCLGEDDTDEASAERMHAREDAVLRAIGVGTTFAVDGRVGADGAGVRAC